jgi:NADPH-dependent glutamate synthase beta subunit-like oxidoreductase
MMEKINIKINNKEITVAPGHTVYEAARDVGIEIPVMCENEDVEHFSSCMVCLVKDALTGKLFPSCSMLVQDGMEVITSDDEILEARRISLELLLSEHVGDCEAPCVTSCPAHMDIPLMNRLLAEAKNAEAITTVKKDIALPAILGRICPAPCEAACRRKGIDGAVSICLLKRFSADADLDKKDKYQPGISPENGKRVAIIGAGPAGLSAAYYLRIRGYGVTVYEKEEKPGGDLRHEDLREKLPEEVIDTEIGEILGTGVELKTGIAVNKDLFNKILAGSDAVVLALGSNPDPSVWGLEMGDKGFAVSKPGYQTSNPKVFAIGNSLRPSKLAVRSVGQGKEVAFSVDQLLAGERVAGEPGRFNSRFGKLTQKEHIEFLKEGSGDTRIEPSGGLESGLSQEEVIREAKRCMHCDCREKDNCILRDLSDLYNANQRSFSSENRVETEKYFQNESVVYEPAKCIKCGICVRMTRKYQEIYGLSYLGRGFEVRIGVPFNESLAEGLSKTAVKVAEACPTGALSKK